MFIYKLKRTALLFHLPQMTLEQGNTRVQSGRFQQLTSQGEGGSDVNRRIECTVATKNCRF